MVIVNLTQHDATTEQVAEGVVNLPKVEQKRLQELLTFDELPTEEELERRAQEVRYLVPNYAIFALIGGAPFFMGYLEKALKSKGITPLYAFSRREVVEAHNTDGSVTKTAVFKHIGFVRA